MKLKCKEIQNTFLRRTHAFLYHTKCFCAWVDVLVSDQCYGGFLKRILKILYLDLQEDF